MKITFGNLANLFKTQISLFGNADSALNTDDVKLGDIKTENGRKYIFLETTIGKPRWHSFKEANELKAEGKLTPASVNAFNRESAKQLQTSRGATLGKLNEETEPTEAPKKKPLIPIKTKKAEPKQDSAIERVEKPSSLYGVKNSGAYNPQSHQTEYDFYVYHDGGKLLTVRAKDKDQAREKALVQISNKREGAEPKGNRILNDLFSKKPKAKEEDEQPEPKPDALSQKIGQKLGAQKKREAKREAKSEVQDDLFSQEASQPQRMRVNMPQIKTADYDNLESKLKELNVGYEYTTAIVSSLKPMQADHDAEKVAQIAQKIKAGEIAPDRQKPIVISNDNFIIDGHHRQLGTKAHDPNATVQVLKIDQPSEQALETYNSIAKNMGKTQGVETTEKPLEEFGVSANITQLKKQREKWNEQAQEILAKDTITDEDKKILAKYSGKGGTTENDLTEFYTSSEVARFTWDMLAKFGFKGGVALEPSCGTGVYIHTKPENTLVTGVEISSVSSTIAGILHPHDDIRNMPFEEFVRNERTLYDAGIGNVPFGTRGETRVLDEPDIRTHEEYFVEKLLDKVKDGGYIGLIVPTSVMDSQKNRELREYMLQNAQLLGAFRLPNQAFKHSGTSVTADILFLRKHPEGVTARIQNGLAVDKTYQNKLYSHGIYDKDILNGKYFEAHPDNMLGEEAQGNWGRKIVKGAVTNEVLSKAMENAKAEALDYTDFNPRTTGTGERQLEEGDTIYLNGKQYRLNKNHRWERVDLVNRIERERKLNVDYEKFGVPNREEFHRVLSDYGELVKLGASRRRIAMDYLDVVPPEEFNQAEEVRNVLWEAQESSSNKATGAEQDKFYQATILGNRIKKLHNAVVKGYDYDPIHFEQLIGMLNEFKDRFGNPATDKKLIAEALVNHNLSSLTGAFKEDGSFSDFISSPEKFAGVEKVRERKEYNPDDVATILQYFQNNSIDGTLDTIARYWTGAQNKSDEDVETMLLQNDAVGYLNGRYTTIDRATTGSVWDKLDQWKETKAILEASDDPHRELKLAKIAKQEELLQSRMNYRSIEDSTIKLNSRWVPMKYLNEWLNSEGLRGLKFNPNDFTYLPDVDDDTYSKEKVGFYEDIVNYINGVGLRHGANNPQHYDAIKEAEERLKQFLATHKDREQIENLYNRAFNNYVKEDYSDAPIKIEKMSDSLDLNNYHYPALRRLLAMGRGILAFGVGLGKTFNGIALALLQKQMGLAKKPMIVVPKSVLSNWYSEIQTFTKGKDVKVMVIGSHPKRKNGELVVDENGRVVYEDDTFDQVQKKFNEVSQNDYDIVLLNEEKFKHLTLSDHIYDQYANEVTRKHLEGKDEFTKEGKRRHEFIEAQEGIKGDIKVREGAGKKVEAINFDELGIDSLIVDEAHHFKNLFGLSGRQKVRGVMSQPDTQRSMTMYFLSKYIREKNNGKNVALLTATPTKNNPLEVFNMLQYIAPEEFDQRNLPNITAFYGHFGNVQKQSVMNTAGEMKDMDVLVGFKNLPELRQLFNKYVDRKTAQDVGLKMPTANEKHVLSVMTPLQKKVYGQLRDRALEFLKLQPAERAESEDHIFSMISDMAKATISLKLLQKTGSQFAPTITDEEIANEPISPKMQQAIDSTVTAVKGGEKKLIFVEYKEVQTELMEHLVKAGIPKNKIFIVNADTVKNADQRLKISQEYNAGKYQVIIGNKTMSEGMNFQNETAEIDHLDLPPTPDDLVQRTGRGVRQGNKRDNVRVNYYLTSGTLDSPRNALLQRKKNWQNELLHGTSDVAVNENANGNSYSPEELQVMLSDDPEAEKLILEANKKSAIERQARELKSKALSQFNGYQNMIAGYKRLTPEQRQGDEGLAMKGRIEQARQALVRNKHFENKDVLEYDEPAYVDSQTHSIVPTGHYFTETGKDFRKRGLFQVVKVNPSSREVWVRQIARSTEGDTQYNIGTVRKVDYKSFREHFKAGVQASTVNRDDLQKHLVNTAVTVAELSNIEPELLMKHGNDVLKRIKDRLEKKNEDYSHYKDKTYVPVLDKKTGMLKSVNIGDINETNKGLEKNQQTQYTFEDVYLPKDRMRWTNDILNQALTEKKAYDEEYKSWQERSKYRSGRHRKWDTMPEKGAFMQIAEDVHGYEWHNNLPANFKRVKPIDEYEPKDFEALPTEKLESMYQDSSSIKREPREHLTTVLAKRRYGNVNLPDLKALKEKYWENWIHLRGDGDSQTNQTAYYLAEAEYDRRQKESRS